MERIEVRAVKGRIARVEPNGPIIPQEGYTTVNKTRYIARLLDHWGDIELKPSKVDKAPEVPKVPKPDKPAVSKNADKDANKGA